MKRFLFATIFASPATFGACATSNFITIEPLPVISNVSLNLKKSLNTLRASIESDARNCAETAKGMDSTGEYHSYIDKIIETKKMVALRVSGSMMCDGMHSSSYQYGIAFEKMNGKRLDLNRIYNIATRIDGRLFVRSELVDSVRVIYRKTNRTNPACLSPGWEDDITNLLITFSPLPDGSLALYYAAQDVTAACFTALRLEADLFARFRDSNLAAQFELQ